MIGPAIIESWESTGTQLTSALAIVQSLMIFGVLLVVMRLTRSKVERD